MLDEKLEFEISQYLDGTLSADERNAVEAHLASDLDARAMLAQFRRVDEALRATPPAIPNLEWERVADLIANNIDREEREGLLMPAARTPSRWRDNVRHLALAAALAIASGVGVFVYQHANRAIVPSANQGTQLAVAEGPKIEMSPGPSVAVVGSIGPTSSAAIDEVRLAENIVTRPSRVVWIASGTDAVHDRETQPF